MGETIKGMVAAQTGTALCTQSGERDRSQILETSPSRRMQHTGLPMSSVIHIQSSFGKLDAGAGNAKSRDSALKSLRVLERPASPVFRLRWKHFTERATGRKLR